jgi:hypothetical protein
MFSKPQDQNVGDGAVAVQAAGSVETVTINQTTNLGLTVEEVRSVAKDAFRADFYQLLGQAGDIATARAQKVVEDFLDRVQKENPAALEQANSPDFRYALLTAQKAHARNGDENLEALLVELLVERSREQQRNLQQIVLNEALDVASRLTDDQVAALTVCFVIRRTVNHLIFNFDSWLTMMDLRVQPLVEKAKLSESSISHLAFTGCGVVEMGEVTLAQCFLRVYPGIWQSGFDSDDPVVQQLSQEATSCLRPSAHTLGKLEVFDGTVEQSAAIRKHNVPDEAQLALLDQLIARPHLNDEQVKERCIASRPYMAALFDLWDGTTIKNFMPSSVGIAIAHANVCRREPSFGPLTNWIN